MNINIIDKFSQAIHDAGLGSPDIIADGELHRFHVEGHKSSTKSGWYVLHEDVNGGHGGYGDWKSDINKKFSSHNSNRPLTQFERNQHLKKINHDNHQYIFIKARKQEIASIAAAKILGSTPAALFHSYLMAKKIFPYGIHQMGNLLIIPMHDVNGKLWSFQTINPDGTKYFQKNGRITGCFYQIGKLTKKFYICEGFATASSIATHFKCACFVAFNAGNLLPVSMALKEKYPTHEIVVAADNDYESMKNIGLIKGREAAKITGASLIFPEFEKEAFSGTDFNDLYSKGGTIWEQ